MEAEVSEVPAWRPRSTVSWIIFVAALALAGWEARESWFPVMSNGWKESALIPEARTESFSPGRRRRKVLLAGL